MRMPFFRLPAALLLASAAAAQSSALTTTFTFDREERGSFFDVSVNTPVVITALDLNLDAGVHDIAIYRPTGGGSHVGIETQSNLWTLVEAAHDVVSAGAGNPTPLPLNNPIVINPGGNEGIYVLAGEGRPLNSLRTTSPGAPFVSDPVMTIYEGAGGISLWLTNQTRMWSGTIHYTVGSGSVATNVAVGAGCGGVPFGDAMVYEKFDPASNAFDLANSSHTWTWIGNGYLLSAGNTTGGIVPPTGAGTIAMANEETRPVQLPFAMPTPAGITDTVYLCSNGWLAFEPAAGASGGEQVGRFRDNQARVAFLWDQLQVAAPGAAVDVEVDANNPGAFHVTFTDVPEASVGGANTVQVTLFSSGNVEVKYGAVSMLDGMVGMTTGNGASYAPQTDFSAIGSSPPPPMITGVHVPTVGLAASDRPLLGSTWNLQAFDLRPGSPFAIGVLGVSNPNVPDLAFLGLPGCGLYASLDVLLGPLVVPPGQTTVGYGLDLTGVGAALLGFEVHTQTAVFGNGLNSFDAVTSNGLTGTLGDI